MRLSTIIQRAAELALPLQRSDGSMPTGHNGPWGGQDTPVRTTAHWALVYLKAFELGGAEKWKTAALRCCEFLVFREVLTSAGVFYCRISDDPARRPNGVIGQAWALEALVEAGLALDREDFLETAGRVVSRHGYSFEQHGWRTKLIGRWGSRFDVTLNHQIWFAVLADRLSERSRRALASSADFFKNLEANVDFILPGVISHVPKGYAGENASQDAKHQTLSIGYQSFILYALFLYFRTRGIAHTSYPFLKDALSFSLDRSKDTAYSANPYGYGYNVTGIELAFVAECLGDTDSASWWLNRQFAHTADDSGLFSRNVADAVLVSSRIYEAARLRSDYEVDLP